MTRGNGNKYGREERGERREERREKREERRERREERELTVRKVS
jgi:hypothetical protein